MGRIFLLQRSRLERGILNYTERKMPPGHRRNVLMGTWVTLFFTDLFSLGSTCYRSLSQQAVLLLDLFNLRVTSSHRLQTAVLHLAVLPPSLVRNVFSSYYVFPFSYFWGDEISSQDWIGEKFPIVRSIILWHSLHWEVIDALLLGTFKTRLDKAQENIL